MEIADFVARADGAEKKLALLTTRCQELEAAVAAIDATKGNKNTAAACSTSSSNNLNSCISSSSALPAALQSNLLTSLNTLRTSIQSDSAERDALRKENEELKISVTKLKYRCDHLVVMLEEEEKQVAILKKK